MVNKKRTLWAIDLNGSPLNQFSGNEFEIYEDFEGKVNLAIDGRILNATTIDEWNKGGSGSTVKYVDLTGLFDDVEFDGQFVELDKEELDIENITVNDIEEGKVIFVDEEYSYTFKRLDVDTSTYPWVVKQEVEETLPNFREVIELAFDYPASAYSEVLLLGFTPRSTNKIYASKANPASLNFDGYISGSFMDYSYDYETLTNTARIGTGFVVDDEKYVAGIECKTYTNGETGDTIREVNLVGDNVLVNGQPIGGGGSDGPFNFDASIMLSTNSTSQFVLKTTNGVITDLQEIESFLEEHTNDLLLTIVNDPSDNTVTTITGPFQVQEEEDGIGLVLMTPYGNIVAHIFRTSQHDTSYQINWSSYHKKTTLTFDTVNDLYTYLTAKGIQYCPIMISDIGTGASPTRFTKLGVLDAYNRAVLGIDGITDILTYFGREDRISQKTFDINTNMCIVIGETIMF